MKSKVEYVKIYGTDSIQLRVKHGVDALAFEEILNGTYQSLWLHSGNFERMFELNKGGLDIKRLKIQSTEMQDVSWLNDLVSLEHIGLRGKVKGDIYFNGLENLRTAELDYSRVTKGLLSSNCALERLGINKLSAPLTEFGDTLCNSLKGLGITGPLNDLDGISCFKNLDSLSLMDMRNLSDVSELKELSNLKKLDITACNKVRFDDVLPCLVALEKLVYENNTLSSLSLMPKNHLKTIALGDRTVIEDRDIEYAFQFPKLERFIFQKKRGYKYSAEEFNVELRRREKTRVTH